MTHWRPLSPESRILLQRLWPVSHDKMPGMRHKVLRTVHDGQICIYGEQFAPINDRCSYDGRFEDRRYLFRIFPILRHDIKIWYAPRVLMWCSETQHVRGYVTEDDRIMLPLDGLPWQWWHRVKWHVIKE